VLSGAPGRQISTRERQVLSLAATGCTNKEISARLGITGATVKFHFANAFRNSK